MKVEFLDEECNEAIVTRGWLWWARVAMVERKHGSWQFEATGNMVGGKLDAFLDVERKAEIFRRDEAAVWTKPMRKRSPSRPGLLTGAIK